MGALSRTKIFTAIGISIIYLILSYFLIGFKSDQLFLVFLFNSLYFINGKTRHFILAFSIFIVYWIVFDYMKAFPNYHYNPVHIEELHNLEKSVFGFNYNGSVVTPNEYFLQNKTTFLNVLTGLFYLCWIPVPPAIGAWLFIKKREAFYHFSLSFFLINLIGFVGYYSYPAAAPWYYQLYGNVFIANTPGNVAGLIEFDKYFDVTIFKSLYEKSSNVFAAMPSLHSAYPVLVVYYAFRYSKNYLLRIFTLTVMVGIWFAAVYTSHHYVLDVLMGICCAILGILIFRVILTIKWFSNFIQYLLSQTTKR